jgi:hypothetical protein
MPGGDGLYRSKFWFRRTKVKAEPEMLYTHGFMNWAGFSCWAAV